MSQFFVTGTDTEVGKTFVSSALLHYFGKQGLSTNAMKPIASGCELSEGQLKNSDALSLMRYSTEALPYEVVNPFAFEPAIAPHIAAQQAAIKLSVSELISSSESYLSHSADIQLIEGAGGWLVPLNEKESYADYVQAMGLPVVLVVSIRLGCINHALLTFQAIQAMGLNVLAWVANMVDFESDVALQNIQSIQNFVEAPLIAKIPLIGNGEGLDQVAEASEYFETAIMKVFTNK